MAISTIGASALDSGVSQLGKNLIQNGAMTVDQRSSNTRTGLGGGDVYVADRWKIEPGGSASARWTASVETSSGPRGGVRWLKWLCTTADASPGADEIANVTQRIEAFNCQPVVASDGSIKAFTISGQVIAHADGASSITFPANLAVNVVTFDGTARQIATDISIAAADTWQSFSINIPADGTGSIDNNNDAGLRIGFCLYGGSGRNVSADLTWEANNGDSNTSSSDNWADATNNYIGFTEVQVEPGSVATDFEHEDYGTTLAKCQRYFRRWTVQDSSSQLFGPITMNAATNAFLGPVAHPVEMRLSPTISISDVGHVIVADGANANKTCSAFTAYPNATAWSALFTVASGTTGGGYIYRDGTDALYFDFTAEL